jgi:hypothetical protein
MITYLVVGRNDGYGVNLHKRTAISLNFFASLCEGPDDEIIYVDCNSAEGDLTLVEAIADTLTPAARDRLKIYRISGEHMLAAIGETPLPFSDELSRNVGIRRSNPRNQWLLSTNCDILLQPIVNEGIHRILEKLQQRFYLCPRVGIPPQQWQALDRMNVGQISSFCDRVIAEGARFPPEKPEEWLRFNAVGDFQLAPRDQWFKIRGTEEGMKLWGHSDANNARRLNLLNGGGRTPDLSHVLRPLHLDHNLNLRNAHEKVLVHNDWDYWITKITAPESRNSDNWGLATENLPVINLPRADLTPELILKTHRRQRNFLSGLKLRVQTALWKKASPLLHKIDQGRH